MPLHADRADTASGPGTALHGHETAAGLTWLQGTALYIGAVLGKIGRAHV